MIRSHSVGRFTAVHKFNLPLLAAKPETDNSWGVCRGYCYIIPDEFLTYRSVAHGWLEIRHLLWSQYCREFGLRQNYDATGNETPWGRAVHDGLDLLELPTICPPPNDERRIAFANDGRNVDDYMESQQARLNKLTGSGVRRSAVRPGGRCYHAATGLAREIRPLLMIGDESVAECDQHASYWCTLVGMLPDCEEKQRAVAKLQSGDWYGQFDYSCLPEGSNHKVEFQKQCLFGKDKRNKSNPLRGQLRKKYPHLANLIAYLQRKHGVRRLSKLLTEGEGTAFVDGAMVELHAMGIPTIGNHDGLICRLTDVDVVRMVLLRILTEHLGFAPKIKVKSSSEIEPSKASVDALEKLNSSLASAV